METITVTVRNGDRVYTFTLPDDLNIDEANINDHISRQPGLYAWQGVIAARAAQERDIALNNYKDKMAEIELQVRAEFAKSGEKTTEDKIRAVVQTNAIVQAFRQKLVAAELNASEAAVLKEATFQKGLMLTALAANLRSEKNQQASA